MAFNLLYFKINLINGNSLQGRNQDFAKRELKKENFCEVILMTYFR